MNIGEHIAGLLGLSGITEDLKDVAILGATTAVTLIAVSAAVNRIPYLTKLSKDKPLYVAAGAVVVGAVGGLAVGRYLHRGVGFSFCAALTGWGLAKLAVAYSPKDAAGAPFLSLSGLGASKDELLLGLSGLHARQVLNMPGQVRGMSNVAGIRDLSNKAGKGWSGLGNLAATLGG